MKYLEGAATSVSEVCRILRRRASKLCTHARTDGTVPAVVGLAHARWSAERLMPARIGQSISLAESMICRIFKTLFTGRESECAVQAPYDRRVKCEHRPTPRVETEPGRRWQQECYSRRRRDRGRQDQPTEGCFHMPPPTRPAKRVQC